MSTNRNTALLFVCVVAFPAAAWPGGGSPPKSSGQGGTVHVNGYTRKDGTYVQPHTRHAPGTRTTPPAGPPLAPRTTPPVARTTPPPVGRTDSPPSPPPAPGPTEQPPVVRTPTHVIKALGGGVPLSKMYRNVQVYEAARQGETQAMVDDGRIVLLTKPTEVVFLPAPELEGFVGVTLVDDPKKLGLLFVRRYHLTPLPSPKD